MDEEFMKNSIWNNPSKTTANVKDNPDQLEILRKLLNLTDGESSEKLAALNKKMRILEKIELSLEQEHIFSRVVKDLGDIFVILQKLHNLEKINLASDVLSTLLETLTDEIDSLLSVKTEEYQSSLRSQLFSIKERSVFQNSETNTLGAFNL